VCVVGGDSEHRGFERVAHTLVINPGSLADGHAAWLDLGQRTDNQVELVDCHAPSELVALEIGVSD
jgi:Icc-related predicted phosphoesterase